MVEDAGVSYRDRYSEAYSFFVKEVRGAGLVDIDGNEYTDYWCAYFALILAM